jgi:purine-binding chemotaxis protein CheW
MSTDNTKIDEFVTLQVSNQWFGVPVSRVQEILPPQPMTTVPRAPSSISGLLNLRGQIVTAVDLRTRLGLPSRPQIGEFMNIIVSDSGELFSLLVDSVGDVLSLLKENFNPTPANLDPHWSKCSSGVYQLDKGLLMVLDIQSVINFNN